jgi:hypothetical protein
MKKTENIYVSLQLQKDETSGELLLSIQFDQNAPNFSREGNAISWCPTIEELDFVSEAFGMLAKGKHKQPQRTTPHEEGEEPVSREIKDDEEKEILDRVLAKKERGFMK